MSRWPPLIASMPILKWMENHFPSLITVYLPANNVIIWKLYRCRRQAPVPVGCVVLHSMTVNHSVREGEENWNTTGRGWVHVGTCRWYKLIAASSGSYFLLQPGATAKVQTTRQALDISHLLRNRRRSIGTLVKPCRERYGTTDRLVLPACLLEKTTIRDYATRHFNPQIVLKPTIKHTIRYGRSLTHIHAAASSVFCERFYRKLSTNPFRLVGYP